MKVDIDQLLSGDRRSLAKAITLVESSLEADAIEAQNLLNKILPHVGKSLRVGITGVPGVGKSTFIENFGLYLISQGHKVAVLAIDPSSPISGGSILGDKTRMEHLSQSEQSFIRPSPSSGFMGGVAQKTRESILLCEAAGFDIILVETVGVGQSEYEAAAMVDFFAVLMLPNAGDELQGIKKGILELADAIIINKADGDMLPLAMKAHSQYSNAMDFIKSSGHWKAKAIYCSALEKTNLDKIYQMILDYKSETTMNGHFQNKRLAQNKDWFNKLIKELLELKINSNSVLKNKKISIEQEISEGKKLPLAAAKEYIRLLFN